MIEESWNLNGPKANWTHPTSSCSLKCYFSLIISMQKSKKLLDFSQGYWWSKTPEIWLDEGLNWLATPSQKSVSLRHYLSTYLYLHEKNLWYWLIPSRVIDDQRILPFDFTWGTTGWLHLTKSGSCRCYLSLMTWCPHTCDFPHLWAIFPFGLNPPPLP